MFCVASSGTYFLNDALDYEADADTDQSGIVQSPPARAREPRRWAGQRGAVVAALVLSMVLFYRCSSPASSDGTCHHRRLSLWLKREKHHRPRRGGVGVNSSARRRRHRQRGAGVELLVHRGQASG